MEELIPDNKEISLNRGKELLEKDALKGQKILIVMLYSKNLNQEKENEYIHKDYLLKPRPQSDSCLKDCLDYYGINIDIVENYRDAIEKIISKDEKGKCPYYAIWIINGSPYEELPDGTKEVFLLGQFLDVIKLFWEKGGALIFLAGGSNLQYQTNEFLKILDFDGKKIDFYLVGTDEIKETTSHKGGKYLKADKTGLLKERGLFSKKNDYFNGKFKRLNIDHNLLTLFEGENLSYINTDDFEKLLPFLPFSRDSDGSISSLYYLSNEKNRGNIFIDCGFSKLFLNMKKDGSIFRYFQNLAAWSARPELNCLFFGENIENWRPEYIEYNIDINKRWTNFLPKPKEKLELIKMKTLFAFDNSGSISGNMLYFKEINRLVNKYYKQGDKFYLWGTTYTEQSKSQIEQWINNRRGEEGTSIINIAKLAKENPNHREHLIIVTDGRANLNDIKETDKFLQENNIKFKYVSLYVIGKNGDRSVGAPFCRRCPSKTINILDEHTRIKGTELSIEDINRLNNIFD